MSNFKKNELVVKVISIMSTRSATLQRVESVRKGVVKLTSSDICYRDSDGAEIDPVIPGCVSYLIALDGGEEDLIESSNLPERV